MNLWRWLTTPDPDPGFTWGKMLKLFVRVILFASVATLISSLLSLTPLRPYLNTWWGSLIFILILYVPMARFLLVDSFAPRRAASTGTGASGGRGGSTLSSAQRRKERNRYAGTKKGPPKYGGRR